MRDSLEGNPLPLTPFSSGDVVSCSAGTFLFAISIARLEPKVMLSRNVYGLNCFFSSHIIFGIFSIL